MYPRSLAILFVIPFLAGTIACSPRTPPPQDDAPMKNVPGPKTPYPEITYEKGPAISTPKETLLAWLEAQVKADGSPKYVRMPVVIRFRADEMDIEGGRVGELDIKLSDSGLGVSLADHVRRGCPEKGEGCSMHLVGRWRSKPRSDAEKLLFGEGPVFDLYRVHGPTPAGVDYVEADSAK